MVGCGDIKILLMLMTHSVENYDLLTQKKKKQKFIFIIIYIIPTKYPFVRAPSVSENFEQQYV